MTTQSVSYLSEPRLLVCFATAVPCGPAHLHERTQPPLTPALVSCHVPALSHPRWPATPVHLPGHAVRYNAATPNRTRHAQVSAHALLFASLLLYAVMRSAECWHASAQPLVSRVRDGLRSDSPSRGRPAAAAQRDVSLCTAVLSPSTRSGVDADATRTVDAAERMREVYAKYMNSVCFLPSMGGRTAEARAAKRRLKRMAAP